MAKLHTVLLNVFLHPLRTLNNLDRQFWKSPLMSRFLTRQFHKMYYDTEKRTWGNTFWFGVQVNKCPLDLWIYQEILHEVKPDVIIECGTAAGGSAMYLANMLDIMGKGKVLSVDINPFDGRPKHPRVTYILGSSTADDVVDTVKSHIAPSDKVLVILDSDHSMRHVYNELLIYSKLVQPGSYVIVEDSNQNGYPVSPFYGPGPMEALEKFVAEDASFTIDLSREKFYLTFNPRGYLKRIK